MEEKSKGKKDLQQWKMWLNLKVLLATLTLAAARAADTFSRDDFPPDFVFGAATSAYQVEGAADEDGRTPSILDTFAHNMNMTGAYGDIASDQYHKYKEDVKLMAKMGLDAYRFSISWSRLIPNGRGPVNPKGLEYYNNLINELISHDIQPHVTLHHSDLPQALDDEYGGWLSRRVVKDFKAYADVCFREFGDRVKYWTTMNEPNILVILGYGFGRLPPQRCSHFLVANCSKANSGDPLLAAHNILLAHASAAALYKKKFQEKQRGFIGINLWALSLSPLTNSAKDFTATQRARDYTIGWFLNPIMFGEYPDTMRRNIGSGLPSFTKTESSLVKGSIDFLGINFYYTCQVKNVPSNTKLEVRDIIIPELAIGFIGIYNETYPVEIPVRPWGLQSMLDFLKNSYGNLPIYIHENGQQTLRDSSLDDGPRVKYLQEYIKAMLDSLRNGSHVIGYFVWSFLDVFEILTGYQTSFGLYYVDLNDPNLKRQPKLSAKWYSHFLREKSLNPKLSTKPEKNMPMLPLHNAT